MRRHRVTLALVAPAAVVGLFACLGIQGPCFDVPSGDFGRPVPGTPREAYCTVVDHWYRWLLFPLVAVVLGVVFAAILGRGPRARGWSLALLVVLAVANVVVVSLLNAFVD